MGRTDRSRITAEDPEGLAEAAREAVHAQILKDLERHGLLASPGLEDCPKCGERIIHQALPFSYVKDRTKNRLVCSPCGTEHAVLRMVLPDLVDIGGEA